MATERSTIAKNIKLFREINGDSQLDLALAIGANSSSRVAMYETDKRKPSLETITKIAKHYRITESQLMNGNYSGFQNRLKITERLITDTEARSELAEIMFPIIKSNKALENRNFAKAYHLHLAFRKSTITGNYPDVDLEDCFNAYLESSNLYESEANLLSLLFMVEVGLHNVDLLNGVEMLQNKKINVKEFYKTHYLINEDLIGPSPDVGFDAEELNDLIDTCLKDLRGNNSYAFIVNYFVALRYIFNCIENEHSLATNCNIGSEMMFSEAKLGNPYAIRFFKFYLYIL